MMGVDDGMPIGRLRSQAADLTVELSMVPLEGGFGLSRQIGTLYNSVYTAKGISKAVAGNLNYNKGIIPQVRQSLIIDKRQIRL